MTYFNLGMTYEAKGNMPVPLISCKKALPLIPHLSIPVPAWQIFIMEWVNSRKPSDLNQEIMRISPKEALPYVNIGNYYIFQKDTLTGIKYYEKAVELGAPPDASQFLSKYYQMKGDLAKANYYRKLAEELKTDRTLELRDGWTVGQLDSWTVGRKLRENEILKDIM